MMQNHCIQVSDEYFLFFDERKCSLFQFKVDGIQTKGSVQQYFRIQDPNTIKYINTVEIPETKENWRVKDAQISYGNLEEQNISIIYETNKPDENICVLYPATNLLKQLGFLQMINIKIYDSLSKEEGIKFSLIGNNVKGLKWSPYSSTVMCFVQYDNHNSYSLHLYCTTNKNKDILVTKDVPNFIPFCWGDAANNWLKYSLTYFNKDFLLKIRYIIPKSYVFSTMERISLISTLVSETAQKFNTCKGKDINEKEFDVIGIPVPIQENYDIFWIGTDLYINQNTKDTHSYSFIEIGNWKYDKTAADKISFFSRINSLKAVLNDNIIQNSINMNFFQYNNHYFSYINSQKTILYELKDRKLQEVARLNGLSMPDNFKGIIPNMNLIIIYYNKEYRFCLYSHGIVAELCSTNNTNKSDPYKNVSQEDIQVCDQRAKNIKQNRQQLKQCQNDLIEQKESIKEFYQSVKETIPEINSKIHESIKSINYVLDKEE